LYRIFLFSFCLFDARVLEHDDDDDDGGFDDA